MRPASTFAVALAAASLATGTGTGLPTLVASSTNDTTVINQTTASATPLVKPTIAAGTTVKPSVPPAVETPKSFNYPPGGIHEGHAHHSTCEIFGWPECNHQSECLDRSKCCWKAGACETFDDNLCHPEVTSAITSSSHSQRFPQAAGRAAIFHGPTPAKFLPDQDDDGCWCATSKDGTYGVHALVYPNPNKKCQLVSGLVFHPKEQDHCWGTLACSPHASHDSLCKTYGMCRGWRWEEVHDKDKSSKSMTQTVEDKEGGRSGEGIGNTIAGTGAHTKYEAQMMQTLRSPPLVAIGTFCYYSKEQEGAFKMCGRVWTHEEHEHNEKDSYHQDGDLEKNEHEELDWYHEIDVHPREQDTHLAKEDTWEQRHPDSDSVYHEPAGASRAEYAEAEIWGRKHGRTPEGHYGSRDAEYEQNEHYIEARPHGRQHAKRKMDDYYYAEEEAEGDEEREYFRPTKHTKDEDDATWHKTVKNGFFGEKLSDEMDDKLGFHRGSQGNQKVVQAHDKKGFYHEDEQELWHGRAGNGNEHGHKRQLHHEEEEEQGRQGKESKFHLRKAF